MTLNSLLIKVAGVSLLSFSLCSALLAKESTIALVPEPVSLERNQGVFTLQSDTVIVVDQGNQENAELFVKQTQPSLGYKLKVTEKPTKQNFIRLQSDSTLKNELGAEGYTLKVSKKSVVIKAAGSAGVFYGLQTLRQLLPSEIYQNQKVDNIAWTAPAVTITDYPRFQWRGMHLDVARHFMPKEFVMKFIDTLAMHKMNNLHWHLTEDHGWRIEIKKYPKLTELGSTRKQTMIHPDKRTPGGPSYDGTPHGGYYTQDDIREIVEYARKRHVNIMPEIEMPGHSQAALTAYPEFGCTGEKLDLKCEPGVSPHLYNVDEKTFTFLQDILTEVMDLFPGKYIHIGGDEAPKGQWKASPVAQAKIKELGLKDEDELQSWFIDRMGKFLRDHDRQLVGWQEIMHGGTPEGAVVMPWMNLKSGVDAANAGHDIVVATTHPFYFDSKQSSAPNEPPALMGGPFKMSSAYNFNMTLPDIQPDKQKHVLGVQGQLWSEYMPTPEVIEYQAFPRAIAVAELAWSPREKKNYDGFYRRLVPHSKRLDALDINYRYLDPLPVSEWTPDVLKKSSLEVDVTSQIKSAGNYGAKFQYKRGGSGLEISQVSLLENGKPIVTDHHRGLAGTQHRRNIYKLTLPNYTAGKKYSVKIDFKGAGSNDSYGDITFMHGQYMDAYHIRHYPLGAVPVGYWDTAELAENKNLVEIDLTGLTIKDGEYDLELRPIAGDGGLTLTKLAFYQGNKVIASSTKKMMCQGTSIAAVRLKVKGAKPSSSQALKLMLKGDDNQGEIYLIKVSSFKRDGDKGIWSPEVVAKDYIPVELDVTDLITKAGSYDITFQYKKGGSGLDIRSVALLQDGKQVSIDQHEGFTGNAKRNNVYRINLDEYRRQSTYTLKAMIKGGGGVESHGEITVTPEA